MPRTGPGRIDKEPVMKSYRWIPEDGPGMEHLALRQEGDMIIAQGVVIGGRFGADYGASYTIRCDAAWRVRHARVEVAGGGVLELFADGQGAWRGVDGAPIEELAGCIDIDLTASCFTNTLPIRRLGNALDERQAIDVAYVRIPELTVEKAGQAYSRLGANRYRYEGVANGFQAELEVDEDGLVVRYPGLFRRT